jgi:hydrogenase/urease accessory protein HupE
MNAGLRSADLQSTGSWISNPQAPRIPHVSGLAGSLLTANRRYSGFAACAVALRFLGFLLFTSIAAFAHELRPAYLELREEKSGEFSVLWKTPMRGDLRLALAPEFSGRTENFTPVVTRRTTAAAVQTWRFRTTEPLRGQSLRITGLEGTMTDALVRAEFADGTTWTQRFTPGQSEATIPVRESAPRVSALYLKLGVEHILVGIDHLLFVLALLLITGSGWKLVKTVTAFTVAHSITLGLATLGLVRVPAAPVEAVIALSIVFVAAEIVRARHGQEGLTARAPWIVAFTFGLLHGFGFAGALSEVGLPQGQIPLALLFFNLGVETGQLMFVAVVLAAIALGRQAVHRLNPATLRPQLSTALRLAPPYAIGSAAMYWVIQRITAF